MSATAARGTAALVEGYFRQSVAAASGFFDANAEAIADACRSMAARFDRGGSLLVFGGGAQASDAQHAAVEFVHPVLVGKRALPAIALTSDAGVLTGIQPPVRAFADAVNTLGSPHDIALALSASRPTPAVTSALAAARQRDMLTILLSDATGSEACADIVFRVSADDATVVQEVHETLYHVLWELVHLFFDDDAGMHPYLTIAADDRLRQAAESTRQKCRDVCCLRDAVRVRHSAAIADTARALATRISTGGRLLAFGNGGSATDAQDAAADCMVPPAAGWRPIPALALTNDVGVVTAVANDVGFDHVFSRQVIAFGRRQDIALGISTSGTSRSVLEGLREAKQRGLLTIALAGCDGGGMTSPAVADVCLVAPSDYVPRIQEAHATIWHALLGAVQAELA
jgi:D-sedoheptulose 7-phosphate isomerase